MPPFKKREWNLKIREEIGTSTLKKTNEKKNAMWKFRKFANELAKTKLFPLKSEIQERMLKKKRQDTIKKKIYKQMVWKADVIK